MRHGRFLAALVTVGALLAAAPAAHADIFWANQHTVQQGQDVPGSIGSASTGGFRVNQNLVPNAGDPCSVAADGKHVYWATRDHTIGRANVDGSNADPKLITGIQFSCGQIAVGSDHIYWTEQSRFNPAIGRADLDGGNADEHWFPLQEFPLGLAIDSGHVYWTWRTDPGPVDIGRADIDGIAGSDVNDKFVQGLNTQIYWLAVDPQHIYAAPLLGPSIVRTNIDGTGVEPHFIDVPGAQAPSCGLAIDDSHIYWGAFGKKGNAVARANIDGSGVDPSFITGGRNTCGVAVGPDLAPPPPTSGFTLGSVKSHERRGTATLFARVAEPGRLLLTGRGLKTRLRSPLRARRVRLPVKPQGGKRRLLERNGTVKVRAKVVFHPSCGCREADRRTIRLKKNT